MSRIREVIQALRERRIDLRDFNSLLVGAMLGISLLTLVAVTVAALAFHGVIGKDEYTLFAYFDKGLGLRNGAKIQVNGVNAGRVENITLTDDGKVELTFKMERKYQKHITSTSKVYATRDQNLISERIILITTGDKPGRVLEDGNTLFAGEAQDIETVLTNVIELIDRIDKIARTADTLIQMTMDSSSTVGALIGSDRLYQKIDHAVVKLRSVLNETGDIVETTGDLVETTKDNVPKLFGRADTLTAKLVGIADSVALIIGTLDTTIFQMNSMLSNADVMLQSAGNLLIDGEQTMTRVDDLVGSMSKFWFIRNDIPDRDTVSTIIDEAW